MNAQFAEIQLGLYVGSNNTYLKLIDRFYEVFSTEWFFNKKKNSHKTVQNLYARFSVSENFHLGQKLHFSFPSVILLRVG
jgi:hypothetical protein